MATKNITLDLDAYNRLKGVKLANESFSQAIRRIVKPPLDVDAWIRRIRQDPMSKAAVAAVEKQIAGRRRRVGH